MPIKHFNILLLLSCLFAGCTTSSHICVYDAQTRVPVENAFVYVNEHKMFSPFNASGIYMTDMHGCVDVAESLRDGQVSVFVGKTEYGLNVFTRGFEERENIQLFIAKTKTPNPKTLPIRSPLLNDVAKESLLKDFFRYCNHLGVTFHELPSRSEVILENETFRVIGKR